jgi:hypothetical protein
MNNLTKSFKSIKPRRLVAGALMLTSLLGIISTPAMAADVDVQYDVEVTNTDPGPDGAGMEYDASWMPGSVIYDMFGGAPYTEDLYYDDGQVSMYVDLGFMPGMDQDCFNTYPSGTVTAGIEQLVSTAASASVECSTGCAASSIIGITALFTFTEIGTYKGNITLSWVP